MSDAAPLAGPASVGNTVDWVQLTFLPSILYLCCLTQLAVRAGKEFAESQHHKGEGMGAEERLLNNWHRSL